MSSHCGVDVVAPPSGVLVAVLLLMASLFDRSRVAKEHHLLR